MKSQKINMSKKEEREVEDLFLACFSTHKTLKVTYKNIKNITSQRHFSVLTDFCKKLARFDPDDKIYGTQTRKDFEKDKLEYDELFNKEESGILNEIRLLSNQAYVNPPESMKSSQESDRTKKETFDRNSFPQDVSSSEAQSNNPIS